MGGVHSGTHNLGEALWVHERQRQKCHRESGKCESQSAQSTQDRRKLLKRTRSLAVISEDESRQDREARNRRLGQSTFDLPRRHQLIPRAKLIDRNSLKDRLSKSQQHLSDSYEKFNETKSFYSRSTCGLHSIPSGLSSLQDPLPYSRGSRGSDSDRLNILDWPKPPRRYRSVQALDTVSGLVDIVEDNWPVEGNRSIDCIYTQVKRKRKEHRSLDSILFEDDGELEYFDVLNLLPLSNVRLEFDEEDAKNNNNLRQGSERSAGSVKFHSLEERESTASSNATDEEKCKESTGKEGNSSFEDTQDSRDPPNSGEFDSSSRNSLEDLNPDYSETFGTGEAYSRVEANDQVSLVSTVNQQEWKPDVGIATGLKARRDQDRKVEQAEDHKSIWISDSDDQEEMSRRPQVLKIVDNDVTKRKHRHPTIEIDLNEEGGKESRSQVDGNETGNRVESGKIGRARKIDEANAAQATAMEENGKREQACVENAKSFFEGQAIQKGASRNKQSEGRFERIVKETSNILGKACNVVKGSLGFEARSESSDLGLGSESGSESRRRSVDDGIGDEQTGNGFTEKPSPKSCGDGQKSHGNLTRSRSYVDSIECQEDGPEFDHVRYKIIKSHVFSKSMFSSGKGDVTYEGLMQYLREYSFQELLLDNNVVIIEPVRAETIERKSTPTGKAKSESGCKVSGAQKKSDGESQEKSNEKGDAASSKSPRQSSIRKHFFYHPIRVNRELIDEELPDPDTVRNVRRMFENTLRSKNNTAGMLSPDCANRKSASMKDLTSTEDSRTEEVHEKVPEESRSRCSSRAKDLTKLFENMEKSSPSGLSVLGGKEEPESPRSESKTRILAQSFEARSGHTSPSDSNSSKNKVNRYQHHHHHHHHHHHQNWDAGSVSSGVSSDYPDTDAGSGAHCTSSEDEEAECQEDEGNDTRGPGHYVSQDVLKKIRECGTSVTYYGGKVVNTCNGPLISPLMGNRFKRADRPNDYVKFRLVKSNSCDSRLELTGRLVEGQSKQFRNRDKTPDLSRYAIAETPSIEITTAERSEKEERKDENLNHAETKREPPVVIGLEPKKEERKEASTFKAEFKLGSLDDAKSNYANRFVPSALTRWQINETNWKTADDFGKMEFEEFEVLEDSLNGSENQRLEAAS